MVTGTRPDPPRLFPPSPACSPLPNFEFRVSNFAFLPLSPFPATLTDTPSRKSFACHSYENTGGVCLPANNLSVPSLFQISPLATNHSPLSLLESALTDSSSRKSFRIRSYEKHRGEGVYLSSQRILFRSVQAGKCSDLRIREVVIEDLPEAASLPGHRSGAALAESDSVALAHAFEEHFAVFLASLEIVAPHRVPSQLAIEREAPRFPLPEQSLRVLARDTAAPANVSFVADVAYHGVIRIAIRGKAQFRGRSRPASATPREHGGYRFPLKCDHQPARFPRCDPRWALRIWRRIVA